PVDSGLLAEPVAHQSEGLLATHRRPANYPFTQAGQVQHVNERLPASGHAGRIEALTQLIAGQGTFAAERPGNGSYAQFGGFGRNALLGQPAGIGGGLRRRGQSAQPEVVLAADEVQRASVQPANDQRSIDGEGAVYVRRG